MSGATVIIGSGANELVAAHYLARAGHQVVVIGQDLIDHEDTSLDSGWIPPRIVRDLDLRDAGEAALCVHRPDPWMVASLPDGGQLDLWRDVMRCAESIRRFSPRDAERWPLFCTRMARLARVLQKLYSAPPPDLMTRDPGELGRLAGLAFGIRRMGREGVEDLLRTLPMPVADVLDDWFECDALKGALGAAGVKDLLHGPRSGGTAFRLLHHHVGNAPGVFRPPVSNLRQVLQAKPGIALRRDAVAGIAVREARVASVVLAGGEEIATSLVICGADPRRTLLEWLDPGWLDPEFTRAVSHIRARGVAARLSLALDRPVPLQSLCVAPSLDYLERAYDDVKYGRISRHPYLEARARNPSDGTVVDVQIQYAPYELSEGAWDEARRQSLGENALKMLAHAVPDLAASVKQWSVITPRDFEMHYGFPEGQPHHAELALDQALWLRPVPGCASYRTPVGGLYLCGPATHPGGAIAGAAGANAARVVLQDLRRSERR